jgi:hypothetical protein
MSIGATMPVSKFTATHDEILRILTFNPEQEWKHINYVITCLGYKYVDNGFNIIFPFVEYLEKRRLIKRKPSVWYQYDWETFWAITEKGRKKILV